MWSAKGLQNPGLRVSRAHTAGQSGPLSAASWTQRPGLETGVLCVFLADVSQATLVAVAPGLAQNNTLLAYVNSLHFLQRSHSAFHSPPVLQVLLSVLRSTKPRYSEVGEHPHLSGNGLGVDPGGLCFLTLSCSSPSALLDNAFQNGLSGWQISGSGRS